MPTAKRLFWGGALATALCVLAPAAGLRLVAGVTGAECLIVAADGTRYRSPGLATFEILMNSMSMSPLSTALSRRRSRCRRPANYPSTADGVRSELARLGYTR